MQLKKMSCMVVVMRGNCAVKLTEAPVPFTDDLIGVDLSNIVVTLGELYLRLGRRHMIVRCFLQMLQKMLFCSHDVLPFSKDFF